MNSASFSRLNSILLIIRLRNSFLLKDDAEYICSDVRDFDLIALGESIREAKDTVQSLISHVDDLETMLHLAKTK